MKKLFITTAAVLAFVTGCSLKETWESPGGEVYVRFDMTTTGTKSSLSVDETNISNIYLFAYCDGVLASEKCFSGTSDIGIELTAGSTYNVYALANVGSCNAPVSEEDLPSLRCTMSSINEFSKLGLPMVGMTTLTPGPVESSETIALTRLVSKVGFKVDADEIGGFSVTSVRVMQSALDVLPFADVSAATVVSDGDYASSSDLANINDGGTASFYVLENCQGVLLPGNTDPWEKIPDNISDKAELCTYIEVGAELDGTYGISGSATYRFFLGQDATTDFNVIRNTSDIVTLVATLDGLGNFSWRIEPDIAYGNIAYSLAAADYIGQWGSITFPDASADHPVTVGLGAVGSITIPSASSKYLEDGNEDSPEMLVYTGSSSNTVYLCQGHKSMDLVLTQHAVSETITVEVNDEIGWALQKDPGSILPPGSTITVNEDGSDNYFKIYLWDMIEGEALSAHLFSMPEAVRAVVAEHRNAPYTRSHLYWYFDLELLTTNGTIADTVPWDGKYYATVEDEEFLHYRTLYGVQADGGNPASTMLNCLQNSVGTSTAYNITVNPAFPDQRHLGEVYNYEFALDDLYSDTATLPLYQTSSGTTGATWKLARGSEWAEGDNELEFEDLIIDKNARVLVDLSVSGSDLKFTFKTPTDAAYYPYVGGGTYHIRGTVTNEHTGDEIRGDYSADIVLYLVVGAEVNVYEDDVVYMDISYMPVVSRCEEDVESFWDIWSLQCKWIEVIPASGSYSSTGVALGTSVYQRIPVPDNVVHDVTDLDGMYSNLLYFANEQLRTNGTDFKFYNRYTGDTDEEMRMEDSGVIVEAHRLQDIVTPKIYFVEEYYGTFDNY